MSDPTKSNPMNELAFYGAVMLLAGLGGLVAWEIVTAVRLALRNW